MKYFVIYLLLLVILPHTSYAENLPGITGKLVKSGDLIVDAKTNIYAAGKPAASAPAGGGAGIIPTGIEFEPREVAQQQILIFPRITGEVSCTTPALYNGADGSNSCLGTTNVTAFEGFSGIIANRSMFLVGVFTSDQAIQDITLYSEILDSFSFDGSNTQLNQIFFIGDGRNDKGTTQFFNIPANASHLYLGFVDGDGTGLIGFYDDNLGALSVSYEIHNSAAYQTQTEFQPPKNLDQDLLLYYTFDESIYINPLESDKVNVQGCLADSSPFGFHGVDYDGSIKDGYDDAKYNMAITMDNSMNGLGIRIIHPSRDDSGLPLGTSWTIATWFKFNTEHPNFSFNTSRCYGLGCSAITNNQHIIVNPSNYELSTTKATSVNYLVDIEYVGSGFYMNELDGNWHHLAAVGTKGKTTFYIDGEMVGQTDTQLIAEIESIKGWKLDDLRIYNRALLTSEISVLAEKSTEVEEETPVVSDECIASYSSDGKLYIPCLSLPYENNANLYEVQMQQFSSFTDFTFAVDTGNIKLKQ